MNSNWQSKLMEWYFAVPPTDEDVKTRNYDRLEEAVLKGLSEQILSGHKADKKRCIEELKLIMNNDLTDIFLLLHDLNEYCDYKTKGRSYLAYRGTIYNSYVAYLLNITCFNPLDFDLPIEFCACLRPRACLGTIAVNVDMYTLVHIDKYLSSQTYVTKCDDGYVKEPAISLKFCVTSQMNYLYEMQEDSLTWRDIPLYDEHIDAMYYDNSKAFGIITSSGFKNGLMGTQRISELELVLWENPDLIMQRSRLSGKDMLLFMARLTALIKGTGTWYDNACYTDFSKVNLNDIMCCREDIFDKLLAKGISRENSFKITTTIRLGKGIEDWAEEEMLSHGLSPQEIESMRKIQYIFPRGHAIGMLIPQYYLCAYKLVKPESFYKYYFENIFDSESFNDTINSIELDENSTEEIVQEYKEAIYMIDECSQRLDDSNQ